MIMHYMGTMTRPQTICIIDDEQTLREVVRRYLEHEGFRVVEADSGPEGLMDKRIRLVAIGQMGRISPAN